ncbi:MAG TPA: serine hydrolase domain-containing protein [Gaiellaceae bacterium]|jgi:CubicO group peptidase (beta-lactamase class C family)
MNQPPIEGTVEPGLEAVRDTFAESFRTGDELGAAVAVLVDGRPVVDLWGGTSDDSGSPWRRDTIVNVFSVTKPIAAACLLLLVERGRLGLDDRVSSVWPEFAAAGKERVTVRQVLAHQAGLDVFERRLELDDLLDWSRATDLLAGSPPRWPPGSTHGEHAAFYGHLVGELVRRLDGRSLGSFLRDELAVPWELDFHVGLGPEEIARTADVTDPDGAYRRDALEAAATYRLALDNPPAMLDVATVNSERWRRAEIPAVNGHGTALAVARFYSGLAAGGQLDGMRLLSADLARGMVNPEREGLDEVLGEPVAWGLGVQVDPQWFGLGGIGGSGGWWDARGYALGYVTRRLGTHERVEAVERALVASL